MTKIVNLQLHRVHFDSVGAQHVNYEPALWVFIVLLNGRIPPFF